METKKELEKEERTIFIVLAIIVMIAIGVLVTWYFTKDKELEDKDTDTDTKIEIVDKQKKKDTSDQTVVEDTKKDDVETVVTVISSKVNEATPVTVVNVSDVEETNTENTVTTIIDFNYSDRLYVVGQTLKFKLANIIDPSNDLEVDLTNASITSIKIFDDTVFDFIENVETYSMDKNQNITFNEPGVYTVTLTNIDGRTFEYELYIYSVEEFNSLYNSCIEDLENFFTRENIIYYDETIWNTTSAKLLEAKDNISNNDINLKRNLFKELVNLKFDLEYTKDTEAELADAKSDLDAVVQRAEEKNASEYTAESYAALEDLLDLVEETKNSNDLEAIKQLKLSIESAMDSLVEVPLTDPDIDPLVEQSLTNPDIDPDIESNT